MEFTYHYQCSLLINKDIQTLTKTIAHADHMVHWEQGLVSIQQEKGQALENGSRRILNYQMNDQTFQMYETTIENQLPNGLIQVYELGDVWNRCQSHFEDKDHQTLWIMDVIFKFKEKPKYDQAYFKNKTYQGMLSFKRYIE